MWKQTISVLPPKPNSFGHMPGCSSYACTHMGKDGSLLRELSQAAGMGAVHVQDTCSSSWHRGIANHKPKHSKDGTDGPPASTSASPELLPRWGFCLFGFFSSIHPTFYPFCPKACISLVTPQKAPSSCTTLSWQIPNPATPHPLSQT